MDGNGTIRSLLLFISFVFFFSTIVTPSSSSSSAAAAAAQIRALVLRINKVPSNSLHTVTISRRKFIIDLNANALAARCFANEPKVSCKSSICADAHAYRASYCPSTTVVDDCVPGDICSTTISNNMEISCSSSTPTNTDIFFPTTNGRNPTTPVVVRGFAWLCAGKGTFISLNQSAHGFAGFSRSPLALPAQLSSKVSIRNQFGLCLPSNTQSTGVAFFGEKPFYLLPPPGVDVTRLLTYTPLLQKKNYAGYYIGVDKIAINLVGIPVPPRTFEIDSRGLAEYELSKGGVELSTVEPYTLLRSDIYKPFLAAYSKATSRVPRAMNVAPFGLCLNSTALKSTQVGYAVPQIDFLLTNGQNWTFFGANSFKQVGPEVACLAFVDGGSLTKMWLSNAVTMGAFQMEDKFLLFDLEKSSVGMTTSLLGIRTTCSNFNFTASASV